MAKQIALFKDATGGFNATESFISVLSPASISKAIRNEFYGSDEELLFAVSEAMRNEYQAIVNSGCLLQIDDPVLFDVAPDAIDGSAYRRLASSRIEALNHALRGLPEDRIRYHTRWTSSEDPHQQELNLLDLVDLVLQVRAEGYVIEGASPRHQHEWLVWRDVKLPDGKVLIPGIIDTHSLLVEHPELVAQRLVNFAGLVGRENIIASTDHGICDRLQPDIAWAKFRSLKEGSDLASRQLWDGGYTRRPVARSVGEAGSDAVAGNPGLTTQFTVWYGTTRVPLDISDSSKGFGRDEHPQGLVNYGQCVVKVPEAHRFGEVGSWWWRRILRREFRDDHLRLLAILPSKDAADFYASLSANLAERPEPSILVYLHGYNMTFESAAIRAAQIAADLRIQGEMAFFAWPSRATTAGYLADTQRIQASESQIADFLVNLSTATGAETVHIIAHSMGNQGLARAVQRIVSSASKAGIRFGQIILAAPDIDVSLFRTLAAVYPTISVRTTMYVSRKDHALEMSRWLQTSDRAGFTPPVTVVPQIDTIEVTDIDLTMLGHSYYAEAEAVLYDMKDLIAFNQDPAKRLRLKPATTRAMERYWVVTR